MRTKLQLEQAIGLLGLLLLLRSVNADFKCQKVGRFLDPLSDCERYFICYENNGTLVYKTFKCPGKQLYSVEEARCLTASNLQCKELTGATILPYDTNTEVDPIQEFVCRGEGKFVNEFDPACKSYITCTRLSGQSYSMILHYCPTETIFSHSTFECVGNGEFQCPATANSENGLSSTQFTTTNTTDQLHTSTTQIPQTVDETHQPIATTNAQESMKVPEIPTDFECTRNGRHPYTAQPGCKNYLVCKGSGPFTIEVISCNGTEIYSPNHGRCVLSYQYTCPDALSTTSNEYTTAAQTTQFTVNSFTLVTSESKPTETIPSNNPSASSATTAISSEETSSVPTPTVIEIVTSSSSDTSEPPMTTPSENPSTSSAATAISFEETSSVHSPTIISEPPVTTPSANPSTSSTATAATGEEITTTNSNFICTEIGRFPNLAAHGCSSYILCAQAANGTFISQTQLCYDSYFDPNTRKCSLSYNCADSASTFVIPEVTTETDPTATQSSSTKEDAKTTTNFEESATTLNINTSEPPVTTPSENPSTTSSAPSISFEETSSVPSPTIIEIVTSSSSDTSEPPVATPSENPSTSSAVTAITSEETSSVPSPTIIEIVTSSSSETSEQPVTTPSVNPSTTSSPTSTASEYLITSDASETKSTEMTAEETTIDSSSSIIKDTSVSSAVTETTNEHGESTISVTSSYPTSDTNESATAIDVSTYPPECMADPINQFICPDSGRYKDSNGTDCKTYILCLRTVIGELVYAKLNCDEGTLYSDEARSCVSTEKYSCLVHK